MNKERMLFAGSIHRFACPARARGARNAPAHLRHARLAVCTLCALGTTIAHAADSGEAAIAAESLKALREENRELRAMLDMQQRQLDALQRRFDAAQQQAEPRAEPSGPKAMAPAAAAAAAPLRSESRVILSGEAGVALFAGEADNLFPHREFRVDDAKLFVDASVTRHVYGFAELDLTTRETPDEFFRLGECYLEFADLPAPWGNNSTFTVRAGRLDIPFGEDYQRRGVVKNPLISHSASDIWGVDEGVEVFGAAGPVRYTLAVQNGGHHTLHDYTADKAVVGRLSFNPAPDLTLSLSAMRTGSLDRAGDGLSEVWFAGGFFRAIGSPATTRTFSARLGAIDAKYRWSSGHVLGTAGVARYADDDTAADNRRRFRFFQIEGQQTLTGHLYGAARFSRVDTDKPYPLVGLGTFPDYFFSGNFTEYFSRLGVGLGYDMAENLRLKLEYTRERGQLSSGESRDHGDQFAAEAGVTF